jgi:hypothetical protein
MSLRSTCANLSSCQQYEIAHFFVVEFTGFQFFKKALFISMILWLETRGKMFSHIIFIGGGNTRLAFNVMN